MLGIPDLLMTPLSWLVKPIAMVPVLRRTVSRLIINQLASTTPPRPRPFSMAADYTTWPGLTDRRFTGRHLRVAGADRSRPLPAEKAVVDLFRRGEEVRSTDTSAMFMFFAQWFTDSFLRTDRADHRRNTSNQEIDLCQIYGLTEEKTTLLRSMDGGRLKSQFIGGDEYPPYYFVQDRVNGRDLPVAEEFAELHDQDFIRNVILDDASDEHRRNFFAVGLEHGNSTVGSILLDIVFLREHNRIARVLQERYVEWDDERIFQTTRNVMIVLLLKVVVEDYITHINPLRFPIEAVPFIADGERWNRSNWIAIEFNLLYRWHSLVPDTVDTGQGPLRTWELRNNNPLVMKAGIAALATDFSRSRAARIGLFNTPASLVDRRHDDQPSVEERTVSLMREAGLRSFNDYREQFGLTRLADFSELTENAEVRERLELLYGDVDDLEWYVGIFAEDHPKNALMGELLTVMVGNDAFTQALTNPLLGRHVFNEDTFSAAGMGIIAETSSLQQIVRRNIDPATPVHVGFAC